MESKIKNIKKILVIMFILLFAVLSKNVFASDEIYVYPVDDTEEYQEYMELSDEEKAEVMEPKKYSIMDSSTNSEYLRSQANVLRVGTLLENALESSYDLREIIPNNVVVRNQMDTDSCWAFAGLGMLESNLGMLDYKSGDVSTTYDFSERHMFYSSKRSFFNNNAINEYGYTTSDTSGNFREVQNYLINTMGAIDEEDMPFENNEDYIDISEIQNKEVETTLYDTIEFDDDSMSEEELIAEMKEVISNYGGIFATIHGAQLVSDAYNNDTGALYCDSSTTYPINHAVVIIGWDDNYSKENFNEGNRPSSDGAWIVKNSWGEELTVDLAEAKETTYNEATEYCNANGWYSAEEIPDETIKQLYENAGYGEEQVTIDGDHLTIGVGDNGYMYVSYEDANIYKTMYAIEKATPEKDYDIQYFYDKISADAIIRYNSNEIYIANKYDRDSSKSEYIDKVGVFVVQEMTCKVLINAESDDLSYSNLEEVKLKDGDTVTLEPGFHIIEFAEPVQLTGSTFSVALDLATDDDTITFLAATVNTDENVEYEEGQSYFTSKEVLEETDYWQDLATYSNVNVRGSLSLKAYATYGEVEEEEPTLESIAVTTNPTKTEYTEGESFDSTGMVVTATYSDGSTKIITDYSVLDGSSLASDQQHVTISYTENGVTKTTSLSITVNSKSQETTVTNIEISNLPTKLEYIQNEEDLDLTGGTLLITYSDGSQETLSMQSNSVTVTGFDNSSIGKQTITVSYMGQSTTFEIEVVEQDSTEEGSTEQNTVDGESAEETTDQNIVDSEDAEETTEQNIIDSESTEGTTDQNIIDSGDIEDNTGEDDNEEENIVMPVLSDFTNMETTLTGTDIYIYDNDDDSYVEMEIEISNVINGSSSTNYTYYYYFSDTDSETDIDSWVKIEDPQITIDENGVKTITFRVNSNDIPNYSDIKDSDVLYLYLKEEAEAAGITIEQVVVTELEQTDDTDVEIYYEGEDVGTIEEAVNLAGNNNYNSSEDSTSAGDDGEDTTVASGVLPQTGVISLGIVILALAAIGIHAFIKQKNIDK